MSIQAAINAASAGDTILIAAGTYTGTINVTQAVTLRGVDDDAGDGGNDVIITAPGVTAINIQADDVALANLTIRDSATGVHWNGVTVTGTTIDQTAFVDNGTSIRKSTASSVSDVAITDTDFVGGDYGITIYAATNDAGAFDGVTFDNLTFTGQTAKGMYFEQLSSADISDISFNDVGNTGVAGNAIDLNLKYETYSDITFTNIDIDNAGKGAAPNGAIAVKARDDAPSYDSPDQASVSDTIVFNDVNINDTTTGFRVGEPGANNAGPLVTINGITVTNASVIGVENVTQSVLTVNLDDTGARDGSADDTVSSGRVRPATSSSTAWPATTTLPAARVMTR